jgi:hypothetical protein
MYQIKTEEVRQNCLSEIKSLPLGAYEVTIKKSVKSKTSSQRRYWHKLMQIIADHIGEDMEQLKRKIKRALGHYQTVIIDGDIYIELLSSEAYSRDMYSQAIEATLQMGMSLDLIMPNPAFYGLEL